MSIEGQGHIFTMYFPGFVCFVLYWDKLSSERLQDHWSSGSNFSYRAYYRVTHVAKACKLHPWAKVLEHGAEVCVECQPTSMNKRLERCRGHGVFRQETMWKAIEVNHCHGKWKMITHHESDTCNHQGDHDFVLV